MDVTTRAGKVRFVGNLLAESERGTLIGFENHSSAVGVARSRP